MNTTEIYQRITDRFIALLEQGTVPWRRPWADAPPPTNLSTGKAYRGINRLLLYAVAAPSPWWLTFRQAKKLGGSVRKGEKGFPIIFWTKTRRRREEDPETGEKISITQELERPILRLFHVFNASQVDGLALDDSSVPERSHTPAAAIVDAFPAPPGIRHAAQDRACYSPTLDLVTMPTRKQFETDDDYFHVLFHELVHATGHISRLDRFEEDVRDPSAYAAEELVAELGAALLQVEAQLSPRWEESAAYLASWIKRLGEDPALLPRAAAKAQRAADHVLGRAEHFSPAGPLPLPNPGPTAADCATF